MLVAISEVTPADRQATLTWMTSTQDGGSVTGYEVRYILASAPDKSDDTNWTDSPHSGTDTTHTVTGLTGQEYDFQVQAVSGTGSGPWSPTATVRIPVGIPPPNIILEPGDGFIEYVAGYMATRAIQGLDQQHFDLRYIRSEIYPKSDSDWTLWELTNPDSERNTRISGLTNGVKYDIQLRTSYAEGDSEWSNSVKAAPQVGIDVRWDMDSYVVMENPGTITLRAVATTVRDEPINRTLPDFSVKVNTADGTAVETGDYTALDGHTLTFSHSDFTLRTTDGKRRYRAEKDVSITIIDDNDFEPREDFTATLAYATPASSRPLYLRDITDATATVTISDMLVAISQVTPEHEKATLIWTPSTEDGGLVTGYEVRYIPASAPDRSDSSWRVEKGVDIWPYTVEGLTNGQEYDFQVRAVSDAGSGPWSPTATGTPNWLSGPPSVPRNVRVTVTDGGDLRVEWDPPAYDGGNPLTGYWVRLRRISEEAWTGSVRKGPTQRRHDYSEVDPGQEHMYEAQVSATNSAGSGAFSESGPPPAPRSFAVAPDAGAVTPIWQPPPSTGGLAITGYEARFILSSASAQDKADDGKWSSQSIVIATETAEEYKESLSNIPEYASGYEVGEPIAPDAPNSFESREYDLQIRAINARDPGAWSNTYTTTPHEQIVVHVAGDTTNARILTATLTEGGTYDFSITITKDPADVIPSDHPIYQGGLGWSLDAGSAGVADYVDVQNRAINAPAGHFQTNTTHTTGDFTVTTSDDDLVEPDETFLVRVHHTGDGPPPRYFSKSRTAGQDVIYLPLFIRVTIKDNDTTPNPPRNLSVEVNADSAELRWEKPDNVQAKDIVRYEVQYRQILSVDWQTAEVDSGTSLTLTGLSAPVPYYRFRVRAVASSTPDDKASAWTDEQDSFVATTPTLASLVPGHREVVVDWTDGTADTGSSYQVRYIESDAPGDEKNDDAEWTVVDVQGGASTRSHTVPGLTNGQEYDFQVRKTISVENFDDTVTVWSNSMSATPQTVVEVRWESPPEIPDSQNPKIVRNDEGTTRTLTAVAFTERRDGVRPSAPFVVRLETTDLTATQGVDYRLPSVREWRVEPGDFTLIGQSHYIDRYRGRYLATHLFDIEITADNLVDGASGNQNEFEARVTFDSVPWMYSNVRTIKVEIDDADKPDPPQNVIVTTTKATEARVEWEPPGNWDPKADSSPGYRVEWRRADSDRSGGAGEWMFVQTPRVRPFIREEPTSGNTAVTLSWEHRPFGNDEVTGYLVRYIESDAEDKSDEHWTVRTSTGAGTTYTVTGLTNGVSYDFRVRAFNEIGVGHHWSPVKMATPVETAGAPPAPDPQDSEPYVPSEAFETTIPLLSGLRYEVRVHTLMSPEQGTTEFASDIKPAGPTAAPNPPAPPSVTPGDQEAEIEWSAPVSDVTNSVTGYEVRYILTSATDRTDANWTMLTDTVEETSHTVTGLTNGESYDFQVRAFNDIGDSAWPVSVTATPRRMPGAPTALEATPDDRQVVLSWTAPAETGGSAITGYEVRYILTSATDKSDANWTEQSITGTDTTHTVTGLTNGAGYDFEVRAVNEAGESEWSDKATATPNAPPGAPTALEATPDDRQVVLSWTAPAETGGSAITGYEVRYILTSATDKSDANWTEQSITGTDTTHTVTGLTNGAGYDFEVRAVNEAGESEWSDKATATPNAPPGAPTSLTADPGNLQVELSWTAPTGTPAPTGYEVRYIETDTAEDKTDDDNWTVEDGGTASPHTVTGLTNGQSYEFEVRAVNGAVPGPWSDEVDGHAAHRAGCADGPAGDARQRAGGAVLDCAHRDTAARKSRATTSATSCPAPRTSPTDSGVMPHHTGTGTSHTVPALTNGEEYEFQVRAVNEAGGGAWSGSTTATPRTTPGAPTGLGATPADGQAALTWTAPTEIGGSAITGYEGPLHPT